MGPEVFFYGSIARIQVKRMLQNGKVTDCRQTAKWSLAQKTKKHQEEKAAYANQGPDLPTLLWSN